MIIELLKIIKEKGFVNKKELKRDLNVNEHVIESMIEHLIQKKYLKLLDDANVTFEPINCSILTSDGCIGCHKSLGGLSTKLYLLTNKGSKFISTVTRMRKAHSDSVEGKG